MTARSGAACVVNTFRVSRSPLRSATRSVNVPPMSEDSLTRSLEKEVFIQCLVC